ncbi:DUF4097 family beta strand repeat-containing protein [Amycolatopsis sp. MEPSY49]|uniref:DUF4097 family beta strand repeat-containing protein n=1 Tax=Amycolatopsis sp. MEPSY49 TaxID=3151600 RepID=UPI003EFA8EB6
MLTFDTPEPICVAIDLAVGDVSIVASDRADTKVEVRPGRAAKRDVDVAELARVEYAGGRLRIKAVEERHPWPAVFRRSGSIDVKIELPAGSHVRASATMADVRGEGWLGDCLIKNVAGDIRLDRTASLHITTSRGDVDVGRAEGTILVTVGSGAVRIQEIDGTAVIKTSNGNSWVGTAAGDLRLRAANGSVSVGRSHAALEAKVAHGDIRVAEVVRGSVELETGTGSVEVGVRQGTVARLDVRTRYGNLVNTLASADGPDRAAEIGDVRARSAHGDILIRRA